MKLAFKFELDIFDNSLLRKGELVYISREMVKRFPHIEKYGRRPYYITGVDHRHNLVEIGNRIWLDPYLLNKRFPGKKL